MNHNPWTSKSMIFSVKCSAALMMTTKTMETILDQPVRDEIVAKMKRVDYQCQSRETKVIWKILIWKLHQPQRCPSTRVYCSKHHRVETHRQNFSGVKPQPK